MTIEKCNPKYFYDLEPDYSKPIYKLPEKLKNKIKDKILLLYGKNQIEEVFTEINRILGVFYAHKTDIMLQWEKDNKLSEPFDEKDVILITYGDLVTNEHQKPLQILSELCDKYFQGVFNTIHILPFFPSSSDRGFAIRDFLQVDPNLGTWDDILHLKENYKLMFDGVFNHVSSKSFWFQEFLNGNPQYQEYFTSFDSIDEGMQENLNMLVRPRTSSALSPFHTYHGEKFIWTTFSPDQIDLNFQNPKVLLRMIEILLIYVRRGANLIRLDAVTYLWDQIGTTGAHLAETHIIIKLFRDILKCVAPHVSLITETNVPHKENISYFGDGTDEAQMIYNFALPPLLLHTFYTENSVKISQWANDLKNPSDQTTFFNFMDSHDGIGVMGAKNILTEDQIKFLAQKVEEHGGCISYKSEAGGKKSIYELNITSYSALNKEESNESLELQVKRYIAARSIPLVLIGVPGIYLHGLLGSKNDIEGVKIDNDNRSINRDVLHKAELFSILDDRSSSSFQVASKLSYLFRIRTTQKAFHPHAFQKIISNDKALFIVYRESIDKKEHILAITNVSNKKIHFKLSIDELSVQCNEWFDLISSWNVTCNDDKISFAIEPYGIIWLKNKKVN